MADSDTVRSKPRLSDEQFAYLQARHEEIERASIASKLADTKGIEQLTADPEYQRLFEGMGWDEVYDRYQDTPGYDDTLAEKLHQALQRDLESHHAVPATSKSASALHLTNEQAVQLGLRKLNE
jgi:TorA maturation chaperone TorD